MNLLAQCSNMRSKIVQSQFRTVGCSEALTLEAIMRQIAAFKESSFDYAPKDSRSLDS